MRIIFLSFVVGIVVLLSASLLREFVRRPIAMLFEIVLSILH